MQTSLRRIFCASCVADSFSSGLVIGGTLEGAPALGLGLSNQNNTYNTAMIALITHTCNRSMRESDMVTMCKLRSQASSQLSTSQLSKVRSPPVMHRAIFYCGCIFTTRIPYLQWYVIERVRYDTHTCGHKQ